MFLKIYKRKIKKLDNILGRCQLYLMPGTYRLSLSEDVVYNTRTSSSLSRLTFSSKHKVGFISNLANHIVNVFVTKTLIHEIKTNFQGSEVIITSSQKEYKVFDYSNKEVVTIFDSLEKQNKIEKNKLYFSKYFNVPRTIEFKPDLYCQKEKLIIHAPYYLNDAFTDVLQKYLFYCSCNNKPQINHIYWDERCATFAKRFGESAQLLELKKLPIIFTHGDLWASNVIYNGESFFITDFENCSYRFFGYDLMTFICSEWIINNDSSLIELYLAGVWDTYFIKISNLYSLSLESGLKNLFLLAFIVTIFFERWKESNVLDCVVNNFIKFYVPNYNNIG